MTVEFVVLAIICLSLVISNALIVRQIIKLTDDLKDQVIAKDPLELLAIKQAKNPVPPFPFQDEKEDTDSIPLVEAQAEAFRKAISKNKK